MKILWFPKMNMNLTTTRYEYKTYFVLPFERNFEFKSKQKWMHDNWHTAFYFIGFYLLFLYFGTIFMKNRNKYELRLPLVVWNISLAIFSIMGALRTVPEFVYILKEHGFHFSVCIPGYPEVNRVCGFWTWLFILSKIPELIDTCFIVLRKQKLIFLHWYHHIVTALYCWYSFEEYASVNRWFVCMNLMVHSVMYSYFALRCLKFNIPRWLSMSITSSQIVQMFIGSGVCVYAYIKRIYGEDCYVSENLAKISVLMYFSYLVLFVNFFLKSYFGSSGPRKARKEKGN